MWSLTPDVLLVNELRAMVTGAPTTHPIQNTNQ